MEASRDRLVPAAFLLAAGLAGANAVGIRFSNRELDPLWGAGLRFGLAAIVLAAAAQVARIAWPRGPELKGALVFGLVNFAAGYGLAYYALIELHAGFGQTLLALVPLATLLLAVAHGQERLRAVAVAGTVLAFAGVGLMSQAPLRESVPLVSLLAALGSAVCVSEAAVLVRRFPPVHPIVMNAVAMGIGAAILLVASIAAAEEAALPADAETWLALAYLVVVGSAVVFGLYVFVLSRWPASRAAYMFVLMPFVTVALSAWLDDEPVGPELIAGGVLVIAGVYVGALLPAARGGEAPVPEAPDAAVANDLQSR